MQNKKILVTGGAGFIGSRLCAGLLAREYEVTCIDNLSTGKWENIAHLSQIRFIEGDVNDESVFMQLKREKFGAIFHYAATVGVRRTEERPDSVLNDARGIMNIYEYAREHAEKVLYASSSEVYGDQEEVPFQEEVVNAVWSPYTAVKMYGEQAMRALVSQGGVPALSLRFFNVYGPGQAGSSYGFVVSRFVEQALKGDGLTVHGDGSQTRDFVYLEDNVTATIELMELSDWPVASVNIGTGKETSVLELARTVIEISGSSSGIEYTPARKVEIARRQADASRLLSLIGRQCTTDLPQGLEKMLAEISLRMKIKQRQLAAS